MMLDAGQTQTMDVSYRAKTAADVLGPTRMTYSLDVDPQDLVVPETVEVHVIWPPGFHPSGPLPAGWKATATGATYTGTVANRGSWQIPLTKG